MEKWVEVRCLTNTEFDGFSGSNNSLENVPRTLFLTPPSLKIKETVSCF